MDLEVIILAAGRGTRMKSELPKVLHRLAGKPLLGHVIDTARTLAPTRLHVVVGHGNEALRAYFDGADDIHFVEQGRQLGTGHAVLQALPEIADGANVLILYGDVPLTTGQTLRSLVDTLSGQSLALLTTALDNPTGYGRILRNADGNVIGIVEEKDATDGQRAIREVNTGIIAAPAALLQRWLPDLSNSNAQGEYYLTDIVGLAADEGIAIHSQRAHHAIEVQGVNTRAHLAELERHVQRETAERLMRDGVTLRDPARIDVRGELHCGHDIEIDVNVVIEGPTVIGNGVKIGPNCIIRASQIEPGTVIEANSVLEEATVGADCHVGPFARLRPGTILADGAKVGNFVETKKSRIGPGSKVNHLTYVGDALIGSNVNVGAGTITCNYDGAAKHQTVIRDGAFIGSNSSLVAPVTIGEGATVGAGSTITDDVGDGELGLGRGRQRNIEGWKRPAKDSDG